MGKFQVKLSPRGKRKGCDLLFTTLVGKVKVVFLLCTVFFR